MPSGECPVCGCWMRVRLMDVDERQGRSPPRRVGDPFPFKCPGFGAELQPGYRVSVRSVRRELAGQVAHGALGTVTAVEGDGGKEIYTVEVRSQTGERLSAQFSRRKLTWLGKG